MGSDILLDQLETILADPKRLATLDETGLLGTPPEAAFDELTRVAAETLRAPVALVSLVDRNRQFFKSSVGVAEPWASQRGTPLSHSFCKYVVAASAPLIVEDARLDPDLMNNPAITDCAAVSYLGVPLLSSTGDSIGTFCVIDSRPREWTDDDLSLVTLLAKAAMTQVELRVALRRKHRELVKQQDAVRAAEERLQLLYGNTTEGVLVLAQDGRVLFATDALLEMAGRRKADVVGRKASELVCENAIESARQCVRASLQQPGIPFTAEYRTRHPDGGWRDRKLIAVNWLAAPSIGGIVLTIRDLTDRKRLEEQLRQTQKMDALGRMAASVAHDFNNLLTAMYGAIDLLLEATTAEDPRRRDVMMLKEAAEGAASLTRQLLTFSRTGPATLRVIDVGAHIQQFSPLLERTLGRKFTLSLDLTPALPPITIDPDQLNQLLLNLTANARDAMPAGGCVAIRTSLSDSLPMPAQTAGTAPSAASTYVRIDVIDTGVGMKAETRTRIFEPFFTTKDEGQGTGLGMATVYGIVTQSGGAIQVASELGEGTQISVYLPAIQL